MIFARALPVVLALSLLALPATAQRRQTTKQRLAAAEAKVNELRTQNAALQAEAGGLRQQLAVAVRERDTALAAAATAQQHRENAEAETRAQRAVRVALEGENAALQQALAEARGQLGTLPQVTAERDQLAREVAVLRMNPDNAAWERLYADYFARGDRIRDLEADNKRLTHLREQDRITHSQMTDRVLAAEYASRHADEWAAKNATLQMQLVDLRSALAWWEGREREPVE